MDNRGFFERGDYEDFSLTRVLLGYGIHAVVSVLLATFVFNYRDVQREVLARLWVFESSHLAPPR